MGASLEWLLQFQLKGKVETDDVHNKTKGIISSSFTVAPLIIGHRHVKQQRSSRFEYCSLVVVGTSP